MLEQSIYTAISKRIGWDKTSVAIPSIDRAYELLQQVGDHSQEAFEAVFRIYRFAEIDANTTDEQIESMNIVYRAFTAGREIFKNQYQQ